MNTNYILPGTYTQHFQQSPTISIKYGTVHYQIPHDQIAYLYKVEGIFFLVDTSTLKLPIFMDSLKEFPLLLNEKKFFRLSDEVIVNRSAIRILQGLDTSIVLASNAAYHNKFLIPKEVESVFRAWLLDYS